MLQFFEAFSASVVTFILVLCLIGTLIPLIPGTLLMWLVILLYGLVDKFTAISVSAFLVISLIALTTGTSDIWLTLFGTKKGGASIKSMLVGIAGAVFGSFILPIIGTIIGYVAGLVFGEYLQHGDWESARKAAIGGVAGWGAATIIQFIGGIFIFVIFLWQVIF